MYKNEYLSSNNIKLLLLLYYYNFNKNVLNQAIINTKNRKRVGK